MVNITDRQKVFMFWGGLSKGGIFWNAPFCGSIVAELWQEVIVNFQESIQRYTAICRRYTVVGLLENGVKAVQFDVLAE